MEAIRPEQISLGDSIAKGNTYHFSHIFKVSIEEGWFGPFDSTLLQNSIRPIVKPTKMQKCKSSCCHALSGHAHLAEPGCLCTKQAL